MTQIIFLEPYPEVMVYKIAKIFKKNGYKTISIRLLSSKGLPDEFYMDAFDKIISFNLKFFKLNLKNILPIFFSLLLNSINILKAIARCWILNPHVIIGRAGPSWHCALTRKMFNKIPFIYFPYDIRSQVSKSLKTVKERGVPNFEIKAERYCFENSNGIMYKGAPEELNFLEGEVLGYNIKLSQHQLNFLPYCSEDFIVPIQNKLSEQDKEIHIVNLDSVGSVGLMELSYIYDDFQLIIKNNIHIHTYSRPNTTTWEEFLSLFKEDSEFTRKYKDVLNSKYFHLHPPLNPKEIVKEISKYDYGISPSGNEKEEPNLKFATGNKVATYLEAGIPILSEAKMEFTNKLIKQLGIGIVYNSEVLKDLKPILENTNYGELQENVIKARKEFSMENNFPRLIKFIEEVRMKTEKEKIVWVDMSEEEIKKRLDRLSEVIMEVD